MPAPKKVMKDQILEGAIQVFRKYGFDNLNARSLAKELNCSTQPIYVNYKNMDEVKDEALASVKEYYKELVKQYIDEEDKTKIETYALAIVKLSVREPQMFRYFYIDEIGSEKRIDEIYKKDMLKVLQDGYGVSKEKAAVIQDDIATFANGMAIMLSLGYEKLKGDELKNKILRHVEAAIK